MPIAAVHGWSIGYHHCKRWHVTLLRSQVAAAAGDRQNWCTSICTGVTATGWLYLVKSM